MNLNKPIQIKQIKSRSPESAAMVSDVRRAMKLTAKLNKLSFDDAEKVREIFSELTGPGGLASRME